MNKAKQANSHQGGGQLANGYASEQRSFYSQQRHHHQQEEGDVDEEEEDDDDGDGDMVLVSPDMCSVSIDS